MASSPVSWSSAKRMPAVVPSLARRGTCSCHNRGVVPPPGPAGTGCFVYDPEVKNDGSTLRAASKPRAVRRTQGFVDEVYELIRADIMSLRIPPDTRISIDNLARQLGVSQTP